MWTPYGEEEVDYYSDSWIPAGHDMLVDILDEHIDLPLGEVLEHIPKSNSHFHTLHITHKHARARAHTSHLTMHTPACVRARLSVMCDVCVFSMRLCVLCTRSR